MEQEEERRGGSGWLLCKPDLIPSFQNLLCPLLSLNICYQTICLGRPINGLQDYAKMSRHLFTLVDFQVPSSHCSMQANAGESSGIFSLLCPTVTGAQSTHLPSRTLNMPLIEWQYSITLVCMQPND